MTGSILVLTDVPPAVARRQPLVWINPRRRAVAGALTGLDLNFDDVRAAEARWRRFAPLLSQLFPELVSAGGHIDSALLAVPALAPVGVRLLVKADHALPVTGCIKARGGIYEVLTVAERIASEHGLLCHGADTRDLDLDAARAAFAEWRIVVGSTGNLGFSVGTIARALGFRTEVHMSRDAKAWKKERLRQLGASVVEHPGDYGAAVAAARADAAADLRAHFVDDEDSVPLFLGYAVAAIDLQAQLAAKAIPVDAEHPLFVYLPCGVGGAPGGIAFGLKHIYGDAVRCIFVEPVGAPCMLVQLAAGTASPAPIAALGLIVETAADGLAVGAASMFIARAVEGLVDACVTCADADLFHWAGRAWRNADLRLEPSAAAGFCGLGAVLRDAGPLGAAACGAGATHVVWTTGGAHLPDAEFDVVLGRSAGAQAAP